MKPESLVARMQWDEEARIKRIKELIEEYADCREEMDSQKVAVEIYELSRKDHAIADNMKSYWANLNAGSER